MKEKRKEFLYAVVEDDSCGGVITEIRGGGFVVGAACLRRV